MASLFVRSLLVGLALAGGGCSCAGDDDDDSTTTPDGSPADAGPDGPLPDAEPFPPDSGIPCKADEECDDEVDCTVDRCDPEVLTCSNRPDDAVCANDQFCDGVERCSPVEGCVPGPARSCSDDDVCTIDDCDEASDECINRPRDFDRDGHMDWHCEAGDDCDDSDSRIFEGAPEICSDQVDNDCDGLVDFEEDCGSPTFDTCEAPLDVTGGGAFEVGLAGTVRDYLPSCGFGATNDAVLTFTLDEASDVIVTVESDFVITTAALQTECGADLSEVDCDWGFPAEIRARSLPAGQYWLIVQAQNDADVLVVLDISEPTPPPPNETCEGAIDVSAGGQWDGSFVDVLDDLPVSCGFGYPELVYTFTLLEPSDVDVTAVSGFNFLPMSVATACGEEAAELRCSYSAPSHQHLYSLPAGQYWILVEGAEEFDFTLDVSFGPPTEPPDGDLCGNAVDLGAGGTLQGTLMQTQDDVEVSCGFAQTDTVYTLNLATPQDVTIQATDDAGQQWMTVAVQDTCGDDDAEPGCLVGNPATLRLRALPAGLHYVVVEAFRPTDFTLEVALSDPVAPTVVDAADTCAAGWPIEIGGGVFAGDTSDASDDYAASCANQARGPDEAYAIELLADARVEISLDPDGWDAVLHVHETTCVGGDDELACNDVWIGDISRFADDLPAGDYYFVVDGRAEDDSGPYILDVFVEFE